jgi:hypothetical protein
MAGANEISFSCARNGDDPRERASVRSWLMS